MKPTAMTKPNTKPRTTARLSSLLLLGVAALGCGGRPATWAEGASDGQAYGLTSAVVLVDRPANRVVALGVDTSGALTRTSLPTGHDVRATQVGPEGDKLFVLSGGHRAGLGDKQPEESPRLTIVDGTTAPPTPTDVELTLLSNPLDGLAIDPTERWAVVYAAGASTALVTNPNELVIVDLAATPPAVHQVTLHSFGGHPERLIFAPPLNLPAGLTHLLVVQSDQDLSLLSLDDPTKPDITVRLADASAVTRPHPAEVVFDDGDPGKTDDARIGVRFDAQTSVMTLELAPSTGAQGFSPTINLADVGGVPSALAFVVNDGKLKLSALVPGLSEAVLVDPATSATSQVMLPEGYRSLSLVTPPVPGSAASATPAPASPDVALLWNGTSAVAGVAFWDLGSGLPYRNIETVGIDAVVNAVDDVPGKNAALKVLSTSGVAGAGGAFFVLDLGARTATPLLTQTGNVSLSVSPTGARVWAFQKGGLELAATDLPSGAVHALTVDSPASALFEIARPDGTHALVVLHDNGGVGATVFDADDPKENERRIYGALLTEGSYGQP